MAQVRCSECGLLALRGVHEDRLFEANLEFRETGKPTSPQGKWIYQYIPLCFARALDLHKQLHDKSHDEVRGAIQRPVECKSFLQWTQGYSPKEHADMDLQRQILELQRGREDADREWRERQAERDHAWREKQAADDRAWREDQEKIAAKRHSQTLSIMGVGAIVATVLATIVGSMIQASWIQKPAVFDPPASPSALAPDEQATGP